MMACRRVITEEKCSILLALHSQMSGGMLSIEPKHAALTYASLQRLQTPAC